MSFGGGCEGKDVGDEPAAVDGGELGLRHVEDLVRASPLVAVAAAGALGAVLGGVVFSRLGRLGLVAVTAYLANGLWHRKCQPSMGEVMEELMR